jgi:LCP family protein required for cell wall assembly
MGRSNSTAGLGSSKRDTLGFEGDGGKKSGCWTIFLFFLFILILLAGTGFYFLKSLGAGYYLKLATNFIYPPVNKLALQDDRTNILVMGIGGANHDGRELTDTIMVVSVSTQNPSLAVISVPRDLWVPEIRAKINSAYFWGDKNTPYFSNKNFPGGKIGFARSIVESVLGIPINYGVVIDFSGFEKVVDDLGGIWVEVENNFTDNLYPVAGRENDLCGGDPKFSCRYETVSFEKGQNYMNGATALKFVRSRHADGAEGGDLAREARQQKVVDAILKKILSKEVVLTPKISLRLLEDLNNYLKRDFDDQTAVILARVIFNSRNSIKRYTIPDELLLSPPISSAYDQQKVLIPSLGNGKWQAIHDWVSQTLK